jgi:hypothetical protein
MQPKKKGYAKQNAVFYKIEDAIFWENVVKDQGAKDIIIVPT